MTNFPSKSSCGGPSFLSTIRAALSLKNHKNPPPLPQPLCFSPLLPEFQQVFRYFDKDGDGKISASELCSSIGSSFNEQQLQAELIELFESSDSDGDGKLGYEDFLRLVEVEDEEEKGRSLREAFAAYEMEGRGFITARSLRRALRRLGEERTLEDCKNMIKSNRCPPPSAVSVVICLLQSRLAAATALRPSQSGFSHCVPSLDHRRQNSDQSICQV